MQNVVKGMIPSRLLLAFYSRLFVSCLAKTLVPRRCRYMPFGCMDFASLILEFGDCNLTCCLLDHSMEADASLWRGVQTLQPLPEVQGLKHLWHGLSGLPFFLGFSGGAVSDLDLTKLIRRAVFMDRSCGHAS